MSEEKFPESQVEVRFQDCDPFGHLNNSKYLEYFLNAREDHLQGAYGFDLYAEARKSGHSWVVARHQIAYLAPAGLGEKVRIRTSLRRYAEQTVLMEAQMRETGSDRLKALLWTDFAYVRLDTGRPAKHPPELLGFLARILLEEEGFPSAFGEREKALSMKPARR